MKWWTRLPRADVEEGARLLTVVLWILCLLGAFLIYGALFLFLRDHFTREQVREDARREAYESCLGSGRSVQDCRSAARRSW
jgi:hypothetical protein